MLAVPEIRPAWSAYLLLGQIVGQVSHHDLGLGGNAIGRGAAFATLASRTSLCLILASRVSVVGLVGDVLQWLNLSGCSGLGWGGSSALSGLLLILYDNRSIHLLDSERLLDVLAHLTGTASTAATGTGTTATTTSGLAAASAFTLSIGIGLLCIGLGLAGELNRNLALQNLLARELGNGALSLAGGGKVDEGVADRALGSRVLGNSDSFATVETRYLLARQNPIRVRITSRSDPRSSVI